MQDRNHNAHDNTRSRKMKEVESRDASWQLYSSSKVQAVRIIPLTALTSNHPVRDHT